MALDHVRDFFHETAMTADPLDPATTTGALFFTRWITHFCAPVFVFLSGISAWLSAQKKSPREASIFLLKRGAWLIAVELVIITLAITFNPLYNVLILQVIWVIGWSMILLGICNRLSGRLVLVIGLILFFGHNILDYLKLPQEGLPAALTKIFFTAFGTVLPIGNGRFVMALYAILPWTGVMFCGYALGPVFRNGFPVEKRQRILLYLGLSVTALFFLLRFINGYGDPSQWRSFDTPMQTFLSFMNTSKYPPSLLYLCMTIGPGLLLLAWLGQKQRAFSEVLTVYGRVPFFYYVVHFFLIHTICVVLFFASGYSTSQIVDPQIPFLFRPLNFGYGLPIVYGIWFLVVASLYLPCKWFNTYKKTHRNWWLSYL